MSEEKGTVQLTGLLEQLMQNPQLLQSVSALLRELGKEPAGATSEEDAAAVEETEVCASATPAEEPVQTDDTAVTASATASHREGRRHRLLCAIRPYLSEGRAKALDSIEAIAELMDILKHA